MLTEPQRAALAARLRRGRTDVPGGIGRRATGLAELALSYGQEQLWFIDRLAPDQPVYNVPHALRLSGPLDPAALGRAVDALIARHEALRTRLVTGADGQPVQVIDPPAPGALEVIDLSWLEDGKPQATLREFIDTEAVRPFSLAEGPLFRIWLARLTGDEHMLLIVVHHSVFDGWSADVLMRELVALYRHEAVGEPAGLAELPIQYADYALWERDRLHGQVLADLEDYWHRTMEGFETVRFPADRHRPLIDDFSGGLAERMLDPVLAGELRELSRRAGITLFCTLLAGLQALLYRYTGQTDLVVGTVTANRTRAELAPLIGYLVNTLPIRVDAGGDPAFADLLARAREATTGAYAHQDLPFGKLLQSLKVGRDPSRAPVFQIVLTYADRDTTPVRAAGVDFAVTDLVIDTHAAKFDLAFLAEGRSDGLWLGCEYKTALFDADTMRRLLAHYEVLLRGVVADPSARLSQLPVLTEDERHRELAEWNDTAAPFPVTCVHHRFETQVAATPDAVAVQFGDETISYAELNRQAELIASRLRRAGAGPDVLVGVCMRTGILRIAALLGVWKAGSGYVPLDTALPASRLSFMITDTAMAVILTDQTTMTGLPDTHATVLCLDTDPREPASPQASHRDTAGTGADPTSIAYVIYTSGSTGQPKGVVVEHRQLINFLHGMITTWRIGPADAVLQFASLNFDASVLEMFMSVLAGARLVLAPPQTRDSPRRLADLIRQAGVTFTLLPSAILGLIADEQFPDLRILLTGGDELPSELVGPWLRPGLRFVNAYGPTEAAVIATYAELDTGTPLPPPIGLPMPNHQAYVLDADLNPVPAGVTGELHIGGAGVARGYLGRPEITSQRFVPDPFTPGGRLYKTGDLVRRRPDGKICFIGRIDHQVKIRGLRVELGEVEAAIARHPAVAQAIVTVITDQAGHKQLAAYVRPAADAYADQVPALHLAGMHDYLGRALPSYMIPSHLVVMAEFPLTTSGKIDRAALPAPGRVPAAAERRAPSTLTETVLTGLYAAVLGSGQVGAADSFFDLGGSSLQVMRLVDLISRETGAEIAATSVFLYPTIRELAAHIDGISSSADISAGSGPLVKLTSGPDGVPLVLIHAIGGTVFGYAPLARELAGTFIVYGLEAPGIRQPDAIAGSLPDLAGNYAELIRTTIPDGPYRLAGWSMGGVVAFEVARQLEQEGAEVCLLALLDPPFALPDARQPGQAQIDEAQLAGRFVTDATRSLGWDRAAPPDPATSTATEQLGWLADRLAAGNLETADDRDTTARLRQRFNVFAAHNRLLAGYRPARPALRAPTLIVSASRSPNAPAMALWPRVLAGPVRTVSVDGDHYTFLRPPLVAGVGASILRWHNERE
jgi:amino acid adenylation domain-containing protein